MGYLEEFQKKINQNNYYEFLKLWEEYYHSEQIDPKELYQILNLAKNSELVQKFGQHADRCLPLWKELPESREKADIIKLIFDIQNTNTEDLANLAYFYLKEKNPDDSLFNEKIRLIGLRRRKDFQGAISGYELLSHLNIGKFVYHTAGWGTGEIIDLSNIREEMTIEFEYVIEPKHLTFSKGLKTLVLLPDNHFLALRFGQPEVLEKMKEESPLELISLLLKDLGPKSASEIKDNLAELIIPEKDWGKWWQNTRAKLKKSTKIKVPEDLNAPFVLRETELSHEEKLYADLEKAPEINTTIQLVYSFLRDFPQTLKNEEFKTALYSKLSEISENPEIKKAHKIQILFLLLEICSENKFEETIASILKKEERPLELLNQIEIIHFQKKLLEEIKKHISSWEMLFLEEFFLAKGHFIRDFVFDELRKEKKQDNLKQKLKDLIVDPLKHPIAFVWFFQKTLKDEDAWIFDQTLKNKFFENLMVLLSSISNNTEMKDLTKKITSLLVFDNFKLVRDSIKNASEDEVSELLLLSTKCQNLSDHEIKIIHSLGETVYPALKKQNEKDENEELILWATKEGYKKIQNKLKNLATVEMVHNAKEIEEARLLGDLRENAEFKAALERRDRIQSELKLLSDQIKISRIITENDISLDKVGVGNIVECQKSDGTTIGFTILGPWESNPEKRIFSFQSQLAQKMLGLKVGEKFSFQNEDYQIQKIASYLR